MAASHPHARIDLKLRDLAQLFNSMDPSPFIERDLDHDAEEFIVSSARELNAKGGFELVLHLATEPVAEKAKEVEDAVRHYFAARAEIKRREFRQLLRRGHVSLSIAAVFLVVCLSLGSLVGNQLVPATLAEVIREGFIIAGWVAMWRPLEIYLYDWWPVRAEWLILQRLARMKVRLVLTAAATRTSSVAGAGPAGGDPRSR